MRIGSSLIALPWIALCAFGHAACLSPDPSVTTPDGGVPLTPSFFADTVMALRSSVGGAGDVMVCPGAFARACGTPQADDCAGNKALGMTDGPSFLIMPAAGIDVGFMCIGSVTIREVGNDGSKQASNDFRIHGTADPSALPVVEVSVDGSNFVAVNPWPYADNSRTSYLPDPGFQLEAANLVQVRYVRISEAGSKGTISVDSVEALRTDL